MAQQVRRKKLTTVTFSANNKVAMPLSRGMVYRELYLRLKGAPTLTAANNTQAKTLQGDEWACVSRIDLVANNTDVIRSFSANALWWLNYYMYGHNPFITSNIGDAATANVSFDSTLILPLWMPQSVRPMDTALDARTLSDLSIEITWGTYTSINADASAWTTEPSLEIYGLQSFNVQGPFNQCRIKSIEKTISATSTEFQVILPVGPMYRGFLMNFTDAGADDGTILNNFKITSGSTVFADMPADVLDKVERARHGCPWIHNTGAAVDYLQLRRGTTYNSVLGWYYYDHVTDGFLSEAIDTLGFSEFNLELDVTVGAGTTKAYIYPIQVIPVRGRAKKAA